MTGGRRAGRLPAAARGGEAGSSTVVVLALCSVLVLLGAVLVALGGVAVTRHRAGVAADLSALAAASRALQGEGTACHAAAVVADAQGSALENCRLAGDVAEVEVLTKAPGALDRLGVARARARAGPAVLTGP